MHSVNLPLRFSIAWCNISVGTSWISSCFFWFQVIQYLWSSRVNPTLKLAPQENVSTGDPAAIDCLVSCDVAPSWGFGKIMFNAGGNKKFQHHNISIETDTHRDSLFIFEKKYGLTNACNETAHHTDTLLLCKGLVKLFMVNVCPVEIVLFVKLTYKMKMSPIWYLQPIQKFLVIVYVFHKFLTKF